MNKRRQLLFLLQASKFMMVNKRKRKVLINKSGMNGYLDGDEDIRKRNMFITNSIDTNSLGILIGWYAEPLIGLGLISLVLTGYQY